MPDDFVIDQEFAERMFQTSAVCDEELERSIIETGGPLDRLHIAEFPADTSPDIVSVLMDGHRRHGVCEKHGLPFTTTRKRFPSREAALFEMDAIQLRRRNLNPTQESIVRARLVAYRSQSEGIGTEAAVEEVAEEAGVATRTVWRDLDTAKSLEHVAPDLRERAANELGKTDIKRLAELNEDEQHDVVAQFDAGEFTSLKAAINGEADADDVIDAPKKPKPKADGEQDAAMKALGKLQDAIVDLHAAIPNLAHSKVAKTYTDRLAALLAAWGR